MTKPRKFIHLHSGEVTDAGLYGLCDSCKRFPPSTARINDIRVCEECKAEKFPQVTEVEFIDSDADFKCPAYSCGYKYNSFREQIIGYCCKEASKKIFIEDPFARLNTVTRILEEARQEEHSAKKEFECKRLFRKEVQKRLSLVAKLAVKEDNSDLDSSLDDESESETDAEPLAKKKREEENEKHQCGICWGLYDDDHPEGVIITCKHKFCFDCITKLPKKECPKCNKQFTDDDVIKLF